MQVNCCRGSSRTRPEFCAFDHDRPFIADANLLSHPAPCVIKNRIPRICALNIHTAKTGLCARVYQQPRPLKFRHTEVQSDCRASSRPVDHISLAPLPSPVSVRCPYNGVKGVKRFPHRPTDAINTALTTVHSAYGKIPNNFSTISLLSFQSQSFQADC